MISFRDSNSKYIKYQEKSRTKSWKNILDDAGAGLRRGITFKQEKYRDDREDFGINVIPQMSNTYYSLPEETILKMVPSGRPVILWRVYE